MYAKKHSLKQRQADCLSTHIAFGPTRSWRRFFQACISKLCKNEQKFAAESTRSTSNAVCVMLLDPDQTKDPGVVARGDGSPVARVHETTKTMHTQRSKWSLLLDINEKPGPSRCVSTSSEDPDHAARS